MLRILTGVFICELRQHDVRMKALALTSLLAASAVGGAAAGGPFFFAIHTPMTMSEDTWNGSTLTFPSIPQARVITEVNCRIQGDYEFVVNNTVVYSWFCQTIGLGSTYENYRCVFSTVFQCPLVQP